MKVGVPKEVKNREYRVALTPIGVHELVQHGHDVVIEKSAGVGSQITDEEYVAARTAGRAGVIGASRMVVQHVLSASAVDAMLAGS